MIRRPVWLICQGKRHTVLGKGNSRSRPFWTRFLSAKRLRSAVQYAICITDTEPDLEPRKVYRVLPDRIAKRDNFLRAIDESGDDYLYPHRYFVPLKLPQSAKIVFAVER